MERRAEAIEMGKGGSAIMVKERRRWSLMTMTVSSEECKTTACWDSSHPWLDLAIVYLIT